ncbi:HIV Tat-specific factor 1 [Sitodiplosis mosellana]|uniref:HIV Tat-specific factor 1 n=1 Tax=Sitodiplosis mosellana TaxID=263140 RepID=UPI002443D79F|nr:HIV Tat-specific factor 1 [Sitodiplosis mosellana]
MSDEPTKVATDGELIPENGSNEPSKKDESANSESQPKETNEINEEDVNQTAGSSVDYTKCMTYSDDGTAIYTDPATKYQYVFDKEKKQWVPKDSGENNPYENEYYRWCTETNQWILKEGASSDAANEFENEHYKWNPVTNEWEAKNGDQKFATSVCVDGQRLHTDSDGVVYFWDEEKKAWFPKIDDDFIAIYQTNYGFIDNTSTKPAETSSSQLNKAKPETEAKTDEPLKVTTGKRKASQPQWFEEAPEQCTKVYVSNLPEDITEEEFIEVMSKCGMIFRDPKTRKLKVKLYAEPNGQLKGDGLVSYIRVESVKLAIDMLDGYEVRGRKIKVQRAQFQMRGDYNPKLKPKRNKQDKEKQKKLESKLLDWRPDKMRGEREKYERVVIIKNLFEPETFDNHVDLIIDYQNDLREECSKCGTVKKVVIYSSEPEGIAEVRMGDPEEADIVVKMMHRRYFGKRLLTAELWDGKTKYKANESEAETKERLSKWDEFLEQGDDDYGKPSETPTATATTIETKED